MFHSFSKPMSLDDLEFAVSCALFVCSRQLRSVKSQLRWSQRSLAIIPSSESPLVLVLCQRHVSNAVQEREDFEDL